MRILAKENSLKLLFPFSSHLSISLVFETKVSNLLLNAKRIPSISIYSLCILSFDDHKKKRGEERKRENVI